MRWGPDSSDAGKDAHLVDLAITNTLLAATRKSLVARESNRRRADGTTRGRSRDGEGRAGRPGSDGGNAATSEEKNKTGQPKS